MKKGGKTMRENHTSRCQECHFYCQSMCIHKKPSIEKRQSVFHLNIILKEFNAILMKRRELMMKITWEQM